MAAHSTQSGDHKGCVGGPHIMGAEPETCHYCEAELTYKDEIEDASAQDVIDALRFALMAQKDPTERVRIVDTMLEFAPETMTDGGVNLIRRLLAEGALKLSLVEH